jgi:transposase InsO family protein
MDERMEFIVDWLRLVDAEVESMSELCRRYGVSRKTGYKLVGRYEASGAAGLQEMSRAPHHHPNAISAEIEAAVLSVRAAHPSWGAKKILPKLEKLHADEALPALSTISEILDRGGLVKRRRVKRRAVPWLSPLSPCVVPNDVWGIDFKGWFRTGDGKRCDPLSLSDLTSRYVLRLQAVDRPDGQHVWPLLDAAFREFGLPLMMRSDNGPPFGSTAAGGLSRLAVKLIKAGVTPERIAPGKPQQNGRHERLHRTVKAETAAPPAATVRAQQRRFDTFRRIFNEERPHEALGQVPPVTVYSLSPRIYDGQSREPEYPDEHEIRRVRTNGEIKWHGSHIFVSEALIGEPIGLLQLADGAWRISYASIELGEISTDGIFAARRTGASPRPAPQPQPLS